MRSSSPAGTRQAKPRGASERSTQTSSASSAGARVRVDLEPAAERRVGRLVAALGEHPSPAERVDDQRRVQVAAVGVDGEARAPVDLRRLEARVALREEVLAQRAVVERRPAPRQPVAHACRAAW